MNSLPFQRFIDLITFDQQVHIFEKEVKGFEKEIADLDNQIKTYTRDVAKAHEIMTAAKKEVDAKELEMKTLDLAEKETQKKIDSAQTQKEYMSLKKEIETLKKQQHEYENTLVAAWNVLETADRDYKQKQSLVEEKITKLRTAIDEKKSKADTVRAHIAELNKERESKATDIPAEWLEKYAVMRSRIPNPVVPVVDDSCSACFYKIPQQDLMALRRRKLLQCKDCYRFLYLPQSQLDPEQEAS